MVCPPGCVPMYLSVTVDRVLADVDDRIEFDEIVAWNSWIEVDAPKAVLPRPIIEQECLQVGVKLGIHRYELPINIHDALDHVAKCVGSHFAEFEHGHGCRDDLHEIVPSALSRG